MGALLDAGSWANIANGMWKLGPSSRQLILNDNVDKFLDIFCRSFKTLLSDQQIHNDLEIVRDLASQGANRLSTIDQPSEFIEKFKRAESAILLQSGVNLDVVVDIISSINDLLDDEIPAESTDHIIGGITRVHHDVCGILKHKLGPIEHVVHHTWQLVKGVSLIGINAGAAANVAAGEGVGGSMAVRPAPPSVAFGCAIVAKAQGDLRLS